MAVIYGIKCLATGKIYVGSSMAFNSRRRGHLSRLRKGTHGNRYLQSAWNKYGEGKFEFVILDECQELDLKSKEQEWILKLNSHIEGFNCAYPVKQTAPSERMTEAHTAYWDGLDIDKKNGRVAHLKTKEQQYLATLGKRVEDHRLVKSIKAKEQWANPEYDTKREELRERINSLKKDPKFWENRAKKLSEKWKDPKFREKNLPQVMEANRKAAERKKELWADPEYRAKHIDHMRAMAKKGGRPKKVRI